MHLIVIPYYSTKEIVAFQEIASILRRLTQTDLAYEFLLASRYDRAPSNRLKERFSQIAPTTSLRCTTSGRGLFRPNYGYSRPGSTVMFWDIMRHVSENYPDDGGFVLWFEADMVPLVPDWLDRLDRLWRRGQYLIMGKFIDREWVARNNPRWLEQMVAHINGGACYSKRFYLCVPPGNFELKKPWDVEIFPFIAAMGPAYYHQTTDLIDFRYRHETMISPPSPQAVLLHGIKDGSARDYVRQRYGIK